jgi:carbonic anhydrase
MSRAGIAAVKAGYSPSAEEALKRLLEGNARYVRGVVRHCEGVAEQRTACAGEQQPLAVILGCSDSRVPPQLVFDQGPGDLFTTRVAGNVATDTVIGSIEYAVEYLSVPLVLVLGHSGCGAVSACLPEGAPAIEGSLGVLLREIAPAVERATGAGGDPLENAIRFNVEHAVERLRASEPVLAPRVRAGELEVVGGLYDLATGEVRLLDSTLESMHSTEPAELRGGGGTDERLLPVHVAEAVEPEADDS